MNKEIDLLIRYRLCRSLELLVPVFVFFVACILAGIIVAVGSEPPVGAELNSYGLRPKVGHIVKDVASWGLMSGGVLGVGIGIGIRYTFTSVYKERLGELLDK